MTAAMPRGVREKGIMKIYFENGPSAGEELEFASPEITVGCEKDNVLCIPEVGVSRYHAVILRGGNGGWLVRDLHSTNGVRVNRTRIDGEKELSEGDRVEFGVQAFRVAGLGESAPQQVFGPRDGEAAARKISRVPSDDAESAPHETISAETRVIGEPELELASLLTSGAEPLFPPKRKAAGEKSGKPGRKHSGLFFYALVGCIAVIAIGAAVLALAPREGNAPQAGSAVAAAAPFSLFFERDLASRDNVFRFTLLLENGTLEFTVDDLKYQRHVSRTEKIADETIELLRGRIARSGLWTQPPPVPSAGGEAAQIRRVMVADGTRVKELTHVGGDAPSCFGIVESLVDDLAETYGVQTVSMTPDELRRLEKSNVTRVEDLSGNRKEKSNNLRHAIRRYRAPVGALE